MQKLLILSFYLATIHGLTWELILNQQDVREPANVNWFDPALAVGNADRNPDDPTAGTYSIISTISEKLDCYRSADGEFEFILVWQNDQAVTDATDIIRWKQTSWIEEGTPTGFVMVDTLNTETVTDVPDTPIFRGLGLSSSNNCYLDGNGNINYAWHCIGATLAANCNGAWVCNESPGAGDDSFPAFNMHSANTVSLYIANPRSNSPGSYGTGSIFDDQSDAQTQCMRFYESNLATILDDEEFTLSQSMCITACGITAGNVNDRCTTSAPNYGCWIGLELTGSEVIGAGGPQHNPNNYEWIYSGEDVVYGFDISIGTCCTDSNIVRPPWAAAGQPDWTVPQCEIFWHHSEQYRWADLACNPASDGAKGTSYSLCDTYSTTCIELGDSGCTTENLCCNEDCDDKLMCSIEGKCCGSIGFDCILASECCSNVCINQKCELCAPVGETCSENCDCCGDDVFCDEINECKECYLLTADDECFNNDECCGNLACEFDTISETPTGGSCCIMGGDEENACEFDNDCCGNNFCEEGLCKECVASGNECDINEDCCDNSPELVCRINEDFTLLCRDCLNAGEETKIAGCGSVCCNDLLCDAGNICCVPLNSEQGLCNEDSHCCYNNFCNDGICEQCQESGGDCTNHNDCCSAVDQVCLNLNPKDEKPGMCGNCMTVGNSETCYKGSCCDGLVCVDGDCCIASVPNCYGIHCNGKKKKKKKHYI